MPGMTRSMSENGVDCMVCCRRADSVRRGGESSGCGSKDGTEIERRNGDGYGG
jgi:hypothetical protein